MKFISVLLGVLSLWAALTWFMAVATATDPGGIWIGWLLHAICATVLWWFFFYHWLRMHDHRRYLRTVKRYRDSA